MELIEADEAGCTVRFTREEYAGIMAVAHIAGLDYEVLNHDALDMSKEQVWAIEDKVYEISAQAQFLRKKNAK